eukprot:1140769-Pelagomonas_calceolata.AAC.7
MHQTWDLVISAHDSLDAPGLWFDHTCSRLTGCTRPLSRFEHIMVKQKCEMHIAAGKGVPTVWSGRSAI